MAYNLQSLITILEQTLNPQQTRLIVDHNKPQLESLLEKSVSLQQILEKSSLSNIESLESQIQDVAHKVEDMIEPHMVDQMLSNPDGETFSFPTQDLQQLKQELDSVMELVVKLIEKKPMSHGSSSRGVSSSNDVGSKSIVGGVDEDPVQSKAVVGVEADLRQLKDRVMGMQSKLEIVPIVGMGGIGKTTLARILYRDQAVVEHFRYRAWATVSQDYNIQGILLSLLCCIIGKELCDQYTGKESHELKDILYRSLYGKRYMIVLDDVWIIKFWDEMRNYFPDNNKSCRIVITTRESEVAQHASSHSKQHEMQLLTEPASWELLRQEVFGGKGDCRSPVELESIGRDISRNCGGLPLAICVVGGLLSKVDRTHACWENVANDVTEAAVSDGQFSNILSLSYNHLPNYLRPCFLYMGVFPEDYKIKASRIIRLWAAEGFLKSSGGKSLEEEAEDCLKALVDRNLVFVRAVKSDGRGKRYGMHDLMRDLCLKRVEKHRFVHVSRKQGEKDDVQGIRRVSIHPSFRDINLFYESESMSWARSFLCTGRTNDVIQPAVLLSLTLLRVLDLLHIEFQCFPKQILQILNLRYLAFSSAGSRELPSDISRLRNLQTLVISRYNDSISLPCEILQMAELRHLVVYGTIFVGGSDWGGFFLDKLETVFSLNLIESSASHIFLQRIPNVKKLGIEDDQSSIFDLSHLHKLEALRFRRGSTDPAPVSPSMLVLPLSLSKLSLTNCKIDGEFMNYLSRLPNLEVLKLKTCQLEAEEPWEWDAAQQEFCTLKFLLLERLELARWEADETNFPRLHRLVIRYCRALEEIPCGIGEITTLQTIELVECNASVVASAELIVEEQRDNGNSCLQLHRL